MIEFLGVPIERHASIGSTNDEAFLRADEGAPEGLIVMADVQTAGRGRRGRPWWDAPGLSLPFSMLLRPALPLPRCPLLALAMACSVAEAAELLTGATLSVKWPNDVLHDGRKLCGILAESRTGGISANGNAPVLVIGTGVNVNQIAADFPADIQSLATSLRIAAGGKTFDPSEVLRVILDRFVPYLELSREDGGDALLRRVTAKLPAVGTAVTVRSAGRTFEGTIQGFTESGALRLLEIGRGEPTVVSVGDLV